MVRRLTVTAGAVALLTSFAVPADAASLSAPEDSWSNTLHSGHHLVAGTAHAGLRSRSGEFQLEVSSYSVELDQFAPLGGSRGPTSTGTGLWWRDDPSGHLQNGHDHTILALGPRGKLVFETSKYKVLWSDHVRAGRNSRLVLTEGGNLIVYNRHNKVVWTSHTTGIYLPAGRTLPSGHHLNSRWGDQQRGRQLSRLTMQTDGNLVWRCNGKLDWQTHTHVAGSYLSMQTNGNLVIRTPAGRAVWSSHTSRGGSYTWLDAAAMEVDKDTARTVKTLWSAHIPYNALC